jgi:hypothetical protein
MLEYDGYIMNMTGVYSNAKDVYRNMTDVCLNVKDAYRNMADI